MPRGSAGDRAAPHGDGSTRCAWDGSRDCVLWTLVMSTVVELLAERQRWIPVPHGNWIRSWCVGLVVLRTRRDVWDARDVVMTAAAEARARECDVARDCVQCGVKRGLTAARAMIYGFY